MGRSAFTCEATHSFAALLVRERQAVAGEIDAVSVVHFCVKNHR
jgi:hypothetical protein